MQFTTSEIAAATGGTVFGEAAAVTGATQDSRNVQPGQLFVPLIAERDGHDFVVGALDAGAGAYLTEREPVGGTAIRVADTTGALRDLAAAARGRIDGPVIGITGSVGKTSTKDLLFAALSRAMSTHASERSFNNEIGVPLTILNAPDDAHALVVEMGSRGIGHIQSLCEVVRPTVGIITTVAAAHTSEFGSIGNIAAAKGELIEALPSDGLAVLNADVALVAEMTERSSAEMLLFGSGVDADVRFRDVEIGADLRASFTIDSPWGTFVARPSTRGAHMVSNATAAAAAALWLGVAPDEVAHGLAEASLSPWRMELLSSPAGATIINDSYNANPTSMRGALDSLAALPADRRIAVLGYMGELGSGERQAHVDVASYAKSLDIDVVAVGTDLYGIAAVDDPVDRLGDLGPTDAVLIKASRSAGLEAVADRLTSAPSDT